LSSEKKVFGFTLRALHEALVTAAFYLDARDLKSRVQRTKQPFSGA